ncbi:MAG: DNA polymerase III subunit epsilon [Ectothiorhodospiraceae bacterium]|nr:DNA polymerase III subunit epsilon [Chromatiales bacterium]MCP5157389.1 DNA polymerase III subunit epsilon [Ectothiorhodospiraceae bacterium]
MRQVVIDTETTGLETEQGHRIIEIGCVELVNRRLTGRHYHQYLQPDRDIDQGAFEVHGISAEFLRDRPRFEDVVDEIVEFLDGAELIIHNAPFDLGFINYELDRLSPPRGPIQSRCGVLDTLALARSLHPGQRNSLDALCKRYAIDNSQRELHGALLDAEILADVYLAMTGGQATLELSTAEHRPRANAQGSVEGARRRPRVALRVVRASEGELAAHRARLDSIDADSGGACIWKRLADD